MSSQRPPVTAAVGKMTLNLSLGLNARKLGPCGIKVGGLASHPLSTKLNTAGVEVEWFGAFYSLLFLWCRASALFCSKRPK